MIHKPMPDINLLRERFEYWDGQLLWRDDFSPHARKGKAAGSLNKAGYYQIGINKSVYRLSRVIYTLHYGDPGDLVVDHIDGDTTNNHIENLQAITYQANTHKSKAIKGQLKSVKGVLTEYGKQERLREYHANRNRL